MGGGAVPIGLGGLVLLLLFSWLTGTNFFSLLDSTSSDQPVAVDRSAPPVSSTPAEEREVDFVDAVTKDIQSTWQTLLPQRYRPTRVVLFRDVINSACGTAESATGPFYCPQDQRVYLDLGFFQEMSRRLGAPGEFARAYVIAHEIGHHVQRLSGVLGGGSSGSSVPIELQADCLAGVWGHVAAQQGRAAKGEVELEPGDMEQGLNAAAAIGDDRLQKMATGRVMPERFTHGSSAQRVEWLRRGLKTGDPNSCDTSAYN
jgi:predicted metalloprotease